MHAGLCFDCFGKWEVGARNLTLEKLAQDRREPHQHLLLAGFSFLVQGVRFGGWGLGSGFQVLRSKLRVPLQSLGFRVTGFGLQTLGFEAPVLDVGCGAKPGRRRRHPPWRRAPRRPRPSSVRPGRNTSSHSQTHTVSTRFPGT